MKIIRLNLKKIAKTHDINHNYDNTDKRNFIIDIYSVSNLTFLE